MVTLRRTSKRLARGASSSTPARSRTVRPIPATSAPIPVAPTPIPVVFGANPASSSNLVQTQVIPPLISQETFAFDGIQFSPYFLNNGDNPGSSIISEILDGTNYNTWIMAITNALDAKNKLVFVDGSLPRPLETHTHYRIWSRCNAMVKSWILNSVTKEIYNSILRFKDASEIWHDLMVRFHITNLPRSYQITQQIWSLHQGSMNLSTYYTKLKTLWDDLDGADCVQRCQNCACCKTISTHSEHTKIIKFLAGLNESYSSARSQIIMKKNVPTLVEVYNLLDQDHSQRSINPVQNASAFHVAAPEIPSASVLSINAAYNGQKSTRPICSHCGYNGHTKDTCYKIHGYPIGFKHKGKQPTRVGWKVLLTSRNEGVALRANPNGFTFKPDCLTLEESWTIFQRIAFPGENTTARLILRDIHAEYKVDEKMEELGKQMIKHCGGLPLALKVLGGLLVVQFTLDEWKRIYGNIKSHIVGGTSFNDRNLSSVYHILYLSFEDFTIDVEKLSYYWAAEGMPRPRYYDGATIREVGDGYIEELVKRNMVISERDARTRRFETCHLHDIVREVCLLKAEEENFIQIVHSTSSENSKSLCKSRRLVVQQCDEPYMEEKLKNPKIRSLLFIEQLRWAVKGSFTRLQLMRVLDLSDVHFGGELPSSIGLLIHLRYLSLYRALVSHLPSSMRNLKMLLYLNLCVDPDEVCSISIPNLLKEMQELKYLSLPLRMHDTVKIELGNLVNLETLENFSTEHGRVGDLQFMTRLRTLSIYIRGRLTMKTLSSSLSELRRLENLTICYYPMYAPMSAKEGLVLDCANLNLRIYMPRLPDEQQFPSYLRNISLSECCLKEDPMPILEKLIHLNEVSLSHQSFCGKRMVCSGGGFPQLLKLDLCGLDEWEEWIVEEGSMPLLHKLTLRNDPKLKEFPDGLKFITSLKELHVILNNWDFKKKLSRGGEDYYKVQHIPLVRFL